MPLTVRQQGRKSGARGGLQSSSQMHNICWQAKETFILCPQKRHKSCFGVILADCVPINFYNLMWVAWLKTGVYDSGSFYWLFNDISVQKLKDSQITVQFRYQHYCRDFGRVAKPTMQANTSINARESWVTLLFGHNMTKTMIYVRFTNSMCRRVAAEPSTEIS